MIFFKKRKIENLRIQLAPHFIYNSLNTIYSVSLSAPSQVSDRILELSEVMRYITYCQHLDRLPIGEVVLFIEKLINFLSLKFDENILELTFDYRLENLESAKITPLIWLPFIENSFKHAQPIDGKIQIHLAIKKIENQLFFFIKNSFQDVNKKLINEGLGLNNVKKQLHLEYKNAYKLNVSYSKTSYKTMLRIPFK